jgi:hypothetical protein
MGDAELARNSGCGLCGLGVLVVLAEHVEKMRVSRNR